MAMEVISSSPQLFLFSLCACFFILHGFIFPPVSGSLTAGTGNETDMQSLLAFKDGITSDPYGVLKSWNHSVHFCQWFGVTCGRRHPQRVTMLDLKGQELRGILPPHIGNLSFLREVWLRNNNLFSKIPPEIGRLRRLQILSLRNNSIGEEIPVNISRCSNLVGLELTLNNLEGGGGFGLVYKGVLHQGQQIMAVKVLNLERQGASRSFIAECEALRRIKHRNLLKVLTACSSIDNQGNDFKAIVYEFMPNGSLDDWIHSTEIHDEMQVDGRNLDLSQRIDVCIGVAYALEYLHHRCEEQIVHCDLKPSNILLDHDMVAHVGDFGLAKLIQEGTSIQYSDNQSSTIGLRGSVGYVAPEYGMGNEVSTFGDIYSFGIVILELCTGKRPTSNDLFNGSLNLCDYVEKALPEEVEVVADNRLLGGGNDREKIEECLHSLFKVGIACAQEQPRDRMVINDAIFQLHAIKKAFLGTTVIHIGPSTTQATPSQVPQ